jgi:hypothetical protein
VTVTLEIPTFTYGKYRALDGTEVEFTDDLMRTLEKNTNFAIAAGALTPPVGYDEIDENGKYKHRSTEAHAHVTGVKFRNGVVHLALSKPSETFRNDVREGRRLRYSGEFHPDFRYTDKSGKEVRVGPTVVGLAALGRFRPALKNPSLVPLSELPFSESLSAADAWSTREELRNSGFVAQTFADGQYAFSEIEIDPNLFGEPKEQHMPMTAEEKAELAALMKTTADAATAPLLTKIAEQDAQIKKFSETSQLKTEAHAFCETFASDRKAQGVVLPKLFIQQGEKMLSDPSYTPAQRADIQTLMQQAPAAMVRGGRGDDDKGGSNANPDEPKALSELRPKHFATREDPASQQKIVDGLVAFSEFKPDAFKGIDGDPVAQTAKLHAYITTRDTAS